MTHSVRGSFPLTMLALGTAEVTCALESGMIYMVLSSLYKEFGDPVRVGWLLTAFTLTSAGSAAICGRLGDLFGRRRMLLIMLSIALAGSLISAFASSLEIVIVGRALQGSTMAVLPLCFGLLRENFDAGRVSRGVGILGGSYAFGSGLGLIVGGVIVDNMPWHAIFYVSAATATLAIILTLIVVPPSQPKPLTGKLDILGGILFAPAIALVLLAITQLAQANTHRTLAIVSALVGVAMLVAWVRHELRQENPLIDVRLLKNRQILWANICIFCIGIGPMLSVTVIMPFLQQPEWTGAGFGVPATVAALIKLPANVTSVIAAIVAGYAAARYGVRKVLGISAFISMIGWAVVVSSSDILLLVATLQVVALAPTQTVLFSLTPQAIMQVAPPDRTSEATGLTQVIRALGQALGAQVMGYLLASSLVSDKLHDGTYPSASAYTLTFVDMCLFSLLAFLAVLAMPKIPPIGMSKKAVNG